MAMMNPRERILRWEVEYDPESTREAYSLYEGGGTDRCTCPTCRNFSVARDQVFAPPAAAIFEKLGIDYHKEREVYLMTPDSDGKSLLCGGWYHFHGRILSSQDASEELPGGHGYPSDLARLTPELSMGFTNHVVLRPKSFFGRPVVQLEFAAMVPWVLPETMPSEYMLTGGGHTRSR